MDLKRNIRWSSIYVHIVFSWTFPATPLSRKSFGQLFRIRIIFANLTRNEQNKMQIALFELHPPDIRNPGRDLQEGGRGAGQYDRVVIWQSQMKTITLRRNITRTGLYRSCAALAWFSGSFDDILFEAIILNLLLRRFGLDRWFVQTDKINGF